MNIDDREIQAGIRGLLNGIIIQAARDYVVGTRWLRDHPESNEYSERMKRRRTSVQRNRTDAIRFFRSDWFNEIVDIDGEELIRRLDAEVEKK